MATPILPQPIEAQAHVGPPEWAHDVDPLDAAFATLAATHPEACSTSADYPDWTPGGAR